MPAIGRVTPKSLTDAQIKESEDRLALLRARDVNLLTSKIGPGQNSTEVLTRPFKSAPSSR